MARHGDVTLTLDRPPDAVFEAIVDVHSLPQWNQRIVEFDDGPDRLEPGDEWVVVMSVLGNRFRSRSKVLELDRAQRRFVHRSAREDGNPTFTVWTWEVVPDDGGAAVTLRWELNPRTPTRHVMAFIRSRMIPDEALASIRQLAQRC
jgi:uncharacterized protein YndB with AHSA1/START domain